MPQFFFSFFICLFNLKLNNLIGTKKTNIFIFKWESNYMIKHEIHRFFFLKTFNAITTISMINLILSKIKRKFDQKFQSKCLEISQKTLSNGSISLD